MAEVEQITELWSTRLPKDSKKLSGLASKCDWVIVQESIIKKPNIDKPSTIFVSMLRFRKQFRLFFDKIFVNLNQPVVLFTASEDYTLPVQTDSRQPAWDRNLREMMEIVRSSALIKVWYTENLDTIVDKMHPIPLGCLPWNIPKLQEFMLQPVPKLSERPFKVICQHRNRGHRQFADRRTVQKLCTGPWKSFVNYIPETRNHGEFLNTLRNHVFALCVHGGGIDPSPKAWEALCMGCIPIIQHSSLDEAYIHLPVAFVQDWTEQSLSTPILREWYQKLRPHFDEFQQRREVLHRLSTNYWWNRCQS